uniref:Porin n=1 Tax=Roseihalotalea indica TaxID=2867963 RepID=A0AA49JJ14_9BACT|nr:porin [Tunicatimonas sp. TK19036]
MTHIKITTFLWLTFLCFYSTSAVFAQGSEIYEDGIRIPVGKDSSKYIRVVLVEQFWVRWMQTNPGTVGSDGEPADWLTDIGSRRSRITLYSQISPRFLVYTQVGINNQTFLNGGAPGQGPKKPQMFVHDAWTEFTVIPEQDYETGEANQFSLSLGAGLHFWNGISRISSPGITNFLTVDLPVFSFSNIERTDQFGRQYGIYAKGMLGKLHYQLHWNKPFAHEQRSEITTERASNIFSDRWAAGGYAAYQFLEKESVFSPYRVGTYAGTKRVFNIGAGFYHHPEASGTLMSGNTDDIQKHAQSVWAVDAFLDYPFGEQGMAVTAYASLFNFDYGPNYFRTVGIMNLDTRAADPSVSLSGYGNAEPLLGTGSILLAQAGLLLPPDWLGSLGKVQPFTQIEYKDLDYLDDTFTNLDVGFNWFLEGHNAKITLQYGTRPIFTEQNGLRLQTDTRGQWTLQTQIYI